jgi:hypothetical protein
VSASAEADADLVDLASNTSLAQDFTTVDQ